jgi:murein hydrolase activator
MKRSDDAMMVGVVIACLAMPIGLQAGNDSSNPVLKDLKSVGHNLQRQKKLLEKLQQRSTSLLQTVAEIDDKIQATEKERRQTELHLENLRARLAEQHGLHSQAEKSFEECRTRLRKRLREIYKLGDFGWMNVVFGSESVADALQGFLWMQRRARADGELVSEAALFRDTLEVSRRRIEEQMAREKALIAQVEKKRLAAQEARLEKSGALGMLHRKETLRKRTIRELEHARRQLGMVMSSIEGKKSVARGFASWRGRLGPPVAGARIEVAFGKRIDPRFNTATKHQGVDLRAASGKKIACIYPGKVVFAQSFRGYGLMAIVDHGGGYYSLYAHMGSLAVKKGERVGRGDKLGTLGDTGSLKGPYLYFEVRKGGRAVDPEKWVRFR